MKVAVYVPHGAVPDRRGFAPAIVAWNFARRLRFASPVVISAAEDCSALREDIAGIPVFRLRQGKLYTRLFTKLTRLDPWPLDRRACALANKIAPDIFHAHQLEFPVARFRAGLRKRLPIIVHAHVTNRNFDPANGVADRYVAVSGYVRTMLVERGYPEAAVEVVPNGADTALFAPAAEEEKCRLRAILNIPADARVLAFVGRKQEIKGFLVFLQVAEQLLARFDDLHVIVVGGEPRDARSEASYSQRQAARRRLSEHPRYLELPPLPHTGLADIFRIADVCLLPSRTETQGMVMLEAMSSGCVTVSSRVGGIPESITHGKTGFLTERRDDAEEALHLSQQALENFSFLENLRAAARADMVERFDWASVSARLEQLYYSLHEGPAR